MKNDNVVLQTVVKIMIPFIQVFGIFIILNGHLSPGGGFAGGTVLGSSLILYSLAYGVKKGIERFPRNNAKILESAGGLFILLIGILTILKGGNFLSNNLFNVGETGKLLSGGIILPITLAIGIKVASTIVTLFYHLLEEKKI